MRVLQVMAGDTHGGAENFFMRLVKSLHDKGLDQHVVIKPHSLRETELANQNIPTTTASFNRTLPFLTRCKIGSIIKDYKPDIVLSWMSRASDLCPRGEFVHVARLGGYYDLKYYKKCDHLVGNTQDIVTYFTDNNWPPQHAHYLPNFVDPPQVQEKIDRKQFETPQDVPLLLTLGRLHQDKAFDVLIRALTKIPRAYVWIAGVGEEESTLKKLAREQGVEDRVRFVGWHQDITPLYNACDIYVCPSRIEPLGNVVIEAWSHQRPVVAAKSKGPEGLITSGKTGLLFDLEDWEGLASAINRLLESPSMAEEMVKNAYAEYQQNFTKERVADAYLSFFKSVLGQKRA